MIYDSNFPFRLPIKIFVKSDETFLYLRKLPEGRSYTLHLSKIVFDCYWIRIVEC